MIKNILRKIISRKTISLIKLNKDYFYYSHYLKRILEDQGEFDVLIGTPLHANLGDHLISAAEYSFLKSISYPRNVYDIPTEVYLIWGERLKKVINNDTTIFINGGGWMGNLWTVEERNIQKIVHDFKENKIIIFPQTIFYDEAIADFHALKDSGIRIYNACKNMTICLRDKASYEFARVHYKNTRLVYCPDIALSYQYNSSHNAESRVAFCLRDDRENITDKNQIQALELYFKENKWTCDYISTIAKKPVPLYQRNIMIQKKLHQFASYRFIVTDRLHGMIYSYITGTPCIVFDNKTRKVSGTYQAWLRESKSLLFIDGPLDLNVIDEFIKSNRISIKKDLDLNKYFKELMEIIKNGQY